MAWAFLVSIFLLFGLHGSLYNQGWLGFVLNKMS